MKKRTAELKIDLYRLMLRKGYYTIQEFADEIGISRSGLSLIVNGRSGGSRATRNAIARKLGTSPDRIWDIM
ncbi:helix-turn-helix domain-containing protein [Alicyclobacillus fodiniaquatilis]|uniref:Helix-turn-helix domain-containing protein n=1 Tax=Alicyclobacillus fodiniaquatilis TaxID=1661150 RepID=A0ABW4JJT3_9BACL